jgi:hypothetical protein
VKFAIDGNATTRPGALMRDRGGVGSKAVFQCATNVGFPGGTVLVFHLAQKHTAAGTATILMNNNLGAISFVSDDR